MEERQMKQRLLSRRQTGRWAGTVKWICMLAGLVILMGIGGCKGRDTETESRENNGETAGLKTVGPETVTDEQLMQMIEEVLHSVSAAEYATVSIPETIRLQVLTAEVTEEEMEEYVQDFLTSFASWEQITDRAVQEGDVVALSYDIFLGGELVESQGSEMAPVLISLGKRENEIDLSAQLIGQVCGEEIRFSIPYPASAAEGEREQDSSQADQEEENGRRTVGEGGIQQEDGMSTAQVTAVIYWIQGEISVPQLDESFISSLPDWEVSSVEELREELRRELEEYKKNRSDYYRQIDLWYQLEQCAQWIDYPEDMQERYRQEVEKEYRQYAAWYGYTSLEEYGEEVLEMTAEELECYLEDLAIEHCKEELLILYLTQEKPELLPDAGQCREKMEIYAYTYGYGDLIQSGERQDEQERREGQEDAWKDVILAAARENILSYLDSVSEITTVDSFEAEYTMSFGHVPSHVKEDE